MIGSPVSPGPDPPDLEIAFYRDVLHTLRAAGVQVLVGGAYAFALHTGIERRTKDLDLFLRRGDYQRAEQALAGAGYRTELAFPHWLGKAHGGSWFVDLIFNSGNGSTPVDEGWFEHAIETAVLGVHAKIVPVEEMIWSKAFVMGRERYDGADVAHMIHARGAALDWPRLLRRFGPQWRVLLGHLVLFGFIYPGEQARVPARVMHDLLDRLKEELGRQPSRARICRGTLLSREQFLHDVQEQGYMDGRLAPYGTMSADDVAAWTDAIAADAVDSPP
jgi:hypothetical protein